SETKAAVERARLLIEQAEALGEPPEDPMALFIVLAGAWSANYIAFNGDLVRELAAQFLALAEKQGTTVPLMVGHFFTGVSLMFTGDIAQGRVHLDRAIALYDPAAGDHARRFGVDTRVTTLCYRTMALWILAIPTPRLRTLRIAQGCTRERPCCRVDVRSRPYASNICPVWKL